MPEVDQGLRVGRDGNGAVAGAQEVGHGAGGISAELEVTGRRLWLGDRSFGEPGLQRLGHLGVDLPPCRLQHRVVHDLLLQGMLEGEHRVVALAAPDEQSDAQQLGDVLVVDRAVEAGHLVQQSVGRLAAQHGQRAHHVGLGPEMIDAGHQRVAERARHGEALAAGLVVDEQLRELLGEQRDALGALGHLVVEDRAEAVVAGDRHG